MLEHGQIPEIMTEVRKGDKEVWFVEKCRKCVGREGKMTSMARHEEARIHLLHICFWLNPERYL